MAAAAAAATTRKRRRAVGALWPCDDAAWTVCQFLLPCGLAMLRAVDRATREYIDVHDLVWDRIRSRIATLTGIHGGIRFPLPAPPWLLLTGPVLSWALTDRASWFVKSNDPYITYSIGVVPDKLQLAVQWVHSNFIRLEPTECIFIYTLKDKSTDSLGDWYGREGENYLIGRRIFGARQRTKRWFDDDLYSLAWRKCGNGDPHFLPPFPPRTTAVTSD